MRNELHIIHHFPDGLPDAPGMKLVLASLKRIETKMAEDKVTADDILAKVTEEGAVEDGVVILLGQLFALVQGQGSDSEKLAAIKAAIQGNEDKLAAAVVANTPAAPAA